MGNLAVAMSMEHRLRLNDTELEIVGISLKLLQKKAPKGVDLGLVKALRARITEPKSGGNNYRGKNDKANDGEENVA